MSTGIEWTDETWNPTTGCTRVSAGCENCYIETTIPFRMEDRHFRDRDGERSHAIGSATGVRMHEDRLDQPLRICSTRTSRTSSSPACSPSWRWQNGTPSKC